MPNVAETAALVPLRAIIIRNRTLSGVPIILGGGR